MEQTSRLALIQIHHLPRSKAPAKKFLLGLYLRPGGEGSLILKVTGIPLDLNTLLNKTIHQVK